MGMKASFLFTKSIGATPHGSPDFLSIDQLFLYLNMDRLFIARSCRRINAGVQK